MYNTLYYLLIVNSLINLKILAVLYAHLRAHLYLNVPESKGILCSQRGKG